MTAGDRSCWIAIPALTLLFTWTAGLDAQAGPPTTNRFYFLSQVGGCANIVGFFGTVQGSIHDQATLVIDEHCVVPAPLTIPRRFTLAGVGMEGAGALVFPGPLNGPALRIEPSGPNEKYVTVRDLSIYGPGAFGNPRTGTGIDVSGGSIIQLERVRVSEFAVGVQGTAAYSVVINQSNVSSNSTNVTLSAEANTWRIRDSILSQAQFWAIRLRGPANDVVIEGNRFESNGRGAIEAGTHAATILANRFEFNGVGFGNFGIRVLPAAVGTRILSNYFSTDLVGDAGSATECAFNYGTASCD